MNFERAKNIRREAAQKRIEERNSRSAQQQLKRLDDLFGVGLGAKRERERLSKVA